MKNIFKILATIICIGSYSTSNAQINPFDVQLFQNRYVANPAMAGNEQGLHLNLGYKNQWSNMPGAPRAQNITLETRKNKVGLGLNINNEKAGLLSYTKAVATYAYHLPLNSNNQSLHMGISLGIYDGNVNMQQVIGDANDPDLVNFNQRKTLFDGDFGIAYTSNRFGIEATLYNLKSQFKDDFKDAADNHIAYVAAEYSFPVSDWTLKSKIAYRGVRNYTDVVDIAFNAITASEKLGFTGIYHTNKSASLGISYLHNRKWQLLGLYNTSAQPINNYTNGSFEIGLKINLTNK
jgi:type IX secretion system PorP/SprF family membrane protein